MSEHKIKIMVSELKPGMYVCELDRPWLETAYILQGIHIKSQENIDELASHCTFVYVDPEKSEASVIQQHVSTVSADTVHISPDILRGTFDAQRTSFHGKESYSDKSTAKEEFPAATKAHDTAATLIEEISICFERNGKLDISAANDTVDTLRESVIRNPDAMLLLSRLKTTGKILYDVAINTSVHLLAFGRHLGLPREELSKLGMGGLLMDIGKMRLPSEIITKSDFLNSEERKLMKQHVTYGETILAESTDIPDGVLEIVAQHHERENGSGYPRGLKANQLNTYSRMAAIVDCYEEFVEVRTGFPPVSAFQAFKELKELSRDGLNSTLVEQFAHCIGMFPVGSLVELNTGEVAIVLTHARSQRFLPSVMIILDAKKKPYDTPLILDLRTTEPAPSGLQYAIAQDLPYGAHGIDAKKYYL